MAKIRKANFELLRILLMSMIIYWHLVAHGVLHINEIEDFGQQAPSIWHLLVLPIRCYAVNCFILLSGYFGIKRFDRTGKSVNDRIHMISVSGILETSHRIPNLDYDLLMKLTLQLTRSMDECLKLYRLMCFNVFAHNRDDHSKNFSYLYDEKQRNWYLSPAYDLTYSNSIGGEHATTVHGNGVNPGMKDILQVAKEIGLGKEKAEKIARNIQECVHERLGEYIK